MGTSHELHKTVGFWKRRGHAQALRPALQAPASPPAVNSGQACSFRRCPPRTSLEGCACEFGRELFRSTFSPRISFKITQPACQDPERPAPCPPLTSHLLSSLSFCSSLAGLRASPQASRALLNVRAPGLSVSSAPGTSPHVPTSSSFSSFSCPLRCHRPREALPNRLIWGDAFLPLPFFLTRT